MTDNQKKIIRKLQWIIYPVAILLLIDFIGKFFSQSPLEANKESNQWLEQLDQVIMIAVFAIVGIGVLALVQQFFTKSLVKPASNGDAANARLLMKIEAPRQIAGNIILVLVALGFCLLLNVILFSPETIFEPEQIERFNLTDKVIFGFFYGLAHFLVLVFGVQLFKGKAPIFIATEKGFCYEPAGISSGWILWEDILEVRTASVLNGSGISYGPRLAPVLGIKLINPDEYNTAAYAPLLQRVVKLAQQLNNYQTEGVGDILLNPTDFGNKYEAVVTLFEQKCKFLK